MAKVEVDKRGAVTVVTLNRPEVHNAIDGETGGLLRDAIQGFGHDADARVLVLTGAGGRAFCTGADLKDVAGLASPPPGEGPLRFSRLDPGKPTIAAIEGYCFAGGLELACWCDFRIAGDTAEFGVLNRRWGIPLVDGGTQRLPRQVGLGTALWLIETGMRIDAARARAIGLVQEVVPAGHALDRARELADRMAAYPQASLRADRASAIAGLGQPLGEGLAGEERLGLASLADPGIGEALARYASGDRPEPPRPAD
ncbi:MAG: enoyl-CoA hydratase-related protein [Actinomycetota bacterium]|nr:enoyl-CoA hydratase-related protein [Actinomycetota bacterium]